MKRLYDLHARLIEETKKLIDDGTPAKTTQSQDQYLRDESKSQQVNMQDQEQYKLSQPRNSQLSISEQNPLKQPKDITISKKHLASKQPHLNLQSTLMDIQKEYLDYELQKTQQEFAVADRNQHEDEFSNTFEVEQILSNAKGHQLEQELPGARKKKSEFIGLLKKCQICSDSDLNYASKPFKLSKKLRDVRIMLERKSNNIEQQLKRSNMNKNRIIEDIKADRVIIRKTLPQQAKQYLNEIDQKQREVQQLPKTIFQPKNNSSSTINASSNDISRTPFSIPAFSTQTRRKRSNILNNQSQPQQSSESSLFFGQQQSPEQQYSIPNTYHQDSNQLRTKRHDQNQLRLYKQRPSQEGVDYQQYGLDNLNQSNTSNVFNNNNNNSLGLTSPSINQNSFQNYSNNLSFIPLPAAAFQDTILPSSSTSQASAVQKRHIQKRFSSMLSHNNNYNLNQNTSETSTPMVQQQYSQSQQYQQLLQHKNSKSDYQFVNFSGALSNNNNNNSSNSSQQPGNNISIERLQYLLFLKEQKNKEQYQSLSSLTPLNSNLNKNSPKSNNTGFIYSQKQSSPMSKYQNQQNSFGLQQSLVRTTNQSHSEAITPQTATTTSTNRNCTFNTNSTIKSMAKSAYRNASVSPSKNNNNNNNIVNSNSFCNNPNNGTTRNESLSPNQQNNISQFQKNHLLQTSSLDGLSKRRAAARVFLQPSKRQAPKQDILANVYNFEEDAYFKHQQIYKYEQENAKILSIKRNTTTKSKGKTMPVTTTNKKTNKLLKEEQDEQKEYLHDAFSSDDDEAPSATEALLENCYEESIKLQKKVLEADKGDLASKVKHLLKIESVNNEIKQLMSWITKK